MARHVDADFVHDGDRERVYVPRPNARRLDINPLTDEIAQNGRSHRRSDSIELAREKNGLREV
jgi:hypothetical protein